MDRVVSLGRLWPNLKAMTRASIIFSLRKASSHDVSDLSIFFQFASGSFPFSLVAFTMSDTTSSPIHVAFSDEEKEELLAQQPSTSSAVRDDSHGQPNAEESPLQVSEIPGSQQSAAKKQRIAAYALDRQSLPLDLKQFLQAVRTYFTQSVNLEREKAAVSMSTFSKCQERMLCKWIFLFYVGAFLFLAVRSFSRLLLWLWILARLAMHFLSFWIDLLLFSRLPGLLQDDIGQWRNVKKNLACHRLSLVISFMQSNKGH